MMIIIIIKGCYGSKCWPNNDSNNHNANRNTWKPDEPYRSIWRRDGSWEVNCLLLLVEVKCRSEKMNAEWISFNIFKFSIKSWWKFSKFPLTTHQLKNVPHQELMSAQNSLSTTCRYFSHRRVFFPFQIKFRRFEMK